MQTETRHTSGPWVSAVSEKDNRAVSIYAGSLFVESPVVVAYALPLWKRTSERDANARLIAAAPDLFATLQRLLQHSGIADAHPEDIDGEDHRAESEARAAIRKAISGHDAPQSSPASA